MSGIDLSNRRTQILAVAGVAGGLLLLTKLRQPAPTAPPIAQATLVPPAGTTWQDIMGARTSDSGTLAQVGTYPTPGPPGTQGATGPAGPTGATGAPGKVVTQPTTPTPKPSTQLPYYCPSGSVMTKERNGSGNDVCQRPDGTQFQVIYREQPTARYPTTNGAADFTRVQYNGKTGYAYKGYLCGSKVCKTGGDGLNLRSMPSFAGTVLLTMPEGATVKLMPGAGEAVSPGMHAAGVFAGPVPVGGQTLTVKRSESIRQLAGRAYGIPDAWPHLANRNGGRVRFVAGDTIRT